jgi:hypothetical protein
MTTSDPIIVSQSAASRAHAGAAALSNVGGAQTSSSSQAVPDAQAFNDAVKKFDDALNSLPTVAVVRM